MTFIFVVLFVCFPIMWGNFEEVALHFKTTHLCP